MTDRPDNVKRMEGLVSPPVDVTAKPFPPAAERRSALPVLSGVLLSLVVTVKYVRLWTYGKALADFRRGLPCKCTRTSQSS